ncbi:MAG: cytidine deaminase [Bacteroidales bacterium]|jgi:cytidine deaminase|nr:cytidine deaminase [Bacteroidales bacterium]
MLKNKLEIDYTIYQNIEELSIKDKELVKEALNACHYSYSAYSHFNVGAAVRLDNDDIVLGANQENVAYPSGLCAERVALFSSAIRKDRKVVAIAISAKDDKGIIQTAYPCGSCRQVMMEIEKQISKQPINILVLRKDKTIIKFCGVDNLLPFSFDF